MSKNNQNTNEDVQNISSCDSAQYSDSDDQMFLNLAPVGNKTTSKNSKEEEGKFILAKMRRLIGESAAISSSQNNPSKPISQKQKQNKMLKSKILNSQTESDAQNQNQKRMTEQRERSRDKLQTKKSVQVLKITSELKKVKQDAAILLIQNQVVKQNDKLSANKMTYKREQNELIKALSMSKLNKFAQIQKQLMIPVEELPISYKSVQEGREEKREKRRQERLLQKKYKEYKVGKVKDQTSNCVFNGIEDYFN